MTTFTVRGMTRIVQMHNKRWSLERRTVADLLHRCYMHEFFKDKHLDGDLAESVSIETAAAYTHIESIIGTLYSRNPAVSVRFGVRGKGVPRVAEDVANTWLAIHARDAQEQASRIALLWEMAAFKVYPLRTDGDVWTRLVLDTVLPWNVVIDEEASRWEDQEYVGQRYWLRLHKALQRFKKSTPDRWTPAKHKLYVGDDTHTEMVGATPDKEEDDFLLQGSVEIFEIYVPHLDRVYFWSPHYDKGESFIQDHKIPARDFKGAPVLPIVPLYYARDPAKPTIGYSSLFRVLDQIIEQNLSRTYRANGTRRSARQYITHKGILSSDVLSGIARGEDGAVYEVDVDTSTDLKALIAAVPQTSIPMDNAVYDSIIQSDLDKARGVAPFTRGEMMGATATEVATTNQYTSSELGRYARTRDESYVRIVEVYFAYMGLYLDRSGADAVVLNDKLTVVRPADIQGDFLITAAEANTTPAGRAARQQMMMLLLPALERHGVPSEVIRKELAATFDVGDGLADELNKPYTSPAPAVPEAPTGQNDAMGGITNASVV